MESSCTRDQTHVPCTRDTVSPGKSLNIYTSKILFWFVHELFLLKVISEEMSNFLYPILAGRILNRFFKDIGHMDDLLPLIFQDFIQVVYQSSQSSHREEQSACFSRIFHRDWRWAFQPGDVSCYLPQEAVFLRERCGCDWEAELTWVTPGAGVATQSCQDWPKAGTCWVNGSPSAFQVSGVDSLYCEHIS